MYQNGLLSLLLLDSLYGSYMERWKEIL